MRDVNRVPFNGTWAEQVETSCGQCTCKTETYPVNSQTMRSALVKMRWIWQVCIVVTLSFPYRGLFEGAKETKQLLTSYFWFPEVWVKICRPWRRRVCLRREGECCRRWTDMGKEADGTCDARENEEPTGKVFCYQIKYWVNFTNCSVYCMQLGSRIIPCFWDSFVCLLVCLFCNGRWGS